MTIYRFATSPVIDFINFKCKLDFLFNAYSISKKWYLNIGMLFYFTRYQSVSDENAYHLHIKKNLRIYVYFYLQYFSKLVRYILVCCRTFLKVCCKHILPISALRCYSLLSVTSTVIIYEFLANIYMDHIENLMALSILRVTEDSSRVEMDMEWWASEKKGDTIWIIRHARSVICQEYLDVRSLYRSVRAHAWMFPYLLIAIGFWQTEFGKFSGLNIEFPRSLR